MSHTIFNAFFSLNIVFAKLIQAAVRLSYVRLLRSAWWPVSDEMPVSRVLSS